jgi:hypothetical protein
MKKTTFIAALFLIFISFHSLFAQSQLTNLPTFYINTENGQVIPENKTYIHGNIVIKSSVPSEELNMATDIRYRGNSSFWGMAKKSYRIKLDQNTRLLNLPAKEKSWVLLANHSDKTLIRNAVAFKIGELLGFEFTPSVRFVDVVLNNNYIGNYMLTDQINVDPKRVPIQKQPLGTTNLPDVSGGYLLEIDGSGGEPVYFHTQHNLPIVIKYPDDDEINNSQINYIKQFINHFEAVLFSSDYTNPEIGYRAWIDTKSLIDWYIACELTGDSDSFWSTYLYKYRNNDKLYIGPLWDFDIAFNNDRRIGDAVLKLMREAAHDETKKIWINQLWSDPWFRESVSSRWSELVESGILNKLLTYIDETAALIDESQKKNFQTWNVLNTRVYQEQFLFPTYQGGVDYLKSYLAQRVSFLSEYLSTWTPIDPPVPFVAEEGYSYTVSNIKSGNAIRVVDQSTSVGEKLELWEPEEENRFQQWEFLPIEGDLHQIVNKESRLAISGNGKGENLIQVDPDNNDKAQQWHVVPVKKGIFGLVNEQSRFSMNNYNSEIGNGTPVIEWDNRIAESLNQQWFITKMTKGEVSIKEIRPEMKIRVYPNPAIDIVHIQLPYPIKQKIFIEIQSIDGRTILRKEIRRVNTHSIELNLSDYTIGNGLYLLKIQDKINHQCWIEKLYIHF